MPKASFVEKHIWDVEGFEVEITQTVDGKEKDVRGDKVLPKQYAANKASKNSFTVAQWKEKFQYQFPGYGVNVLNADGSKARGNTKLSTVRDTYASEDDE